MPKFSVFTPTHNPEYLRDSFESLLSQTCQDFEWVICPNGQISIPETVANHPKTRVVSVPESVGNNVGALKRFACDNCRGAAFVELDHDDLLTPNCLSDVSKLLDRGCGFVYSDAACFATDTLDPRGYDPGWGWELYPVNVYGRRFLATKTFPLTARTLCEVYFAPDHVRCWSREAYYRAGGHDPILSVGDDHELTVRTYLAGIEFGYTNSCGYLYRHHNSNTVKLRNQTIQETTANTREQHLHALVLEWTRRLGRRGVNLHDLVSDGYVWDRDLYHGFPYETDSIAYFSAFDLLQFIPANRHFQLFNEIYRCLMPGGWLLIKVPTTDGRAAFTDPEYVSYWNINSFLWYTDKAMWGSKENVKAKFQAVQLSHYYLDNWHQKHNLQWLRADLMAMKGQRHPGRYF